MRERPIRTFADCLRECANTPDFVEQFNRLSRNCRDGPQDMVECGSGSCKMIAAQVC